MKATTVHISHEEHSKLAPTHHRESHSRTQRALREVPPRRWSGAHRRQRPHHEPPRGTRSGSKRSGVHGHSAASSTRRRGRGRRGRRDAREVQKLPLLARQADKLTDMLAEDHINDILDGGALDEQEGRRRWAPRLERHHSRDTKLLPVAVHTPVVADHENQLTEHLVDLEGARHGPIVAQRRDTRQAHLATAHRIPQDDARRTMQGGLRIEEPTSSQEAFRGPSRHRQGSAESEEAGSDTSS